MSVAKRGHHSRATQPRNPLRVLLVIDELDIGGTEQQILDLVRHLPRHCYEAIVCCFRYGRKAREIEELGIRVVHLPKRERLDPGLIRRLVRMMRQERVDIVHTFLIGANLWGRVAALLARVPVIVASERNVDVWEEPIKRYLGRALATVTQRLVANADAVRNYLISRGLDPQRVVTIRNGIDFGRFEHPVDIEATRTALGVGPDHTMAIVVARMEPQKGHDTVLDAAVRLKNRFPRLRFVFVGGGSRQHEIPSLAAERGLADRVICTGFRTDSTDLIRAADLSVLVSTKEGLSNTLLESMAAGLPVVASNVGGNCEVVAEDAGVLVPPGDSTALAAALARLLEDPRARARMGQNARERVLREFSVDDMVSRTAALYDDLERACAVPAATTCHVTSPL